MFFTTYLVVNLVQLEGLKDESLYSGIKSLSSQRENLAIKECISFFCCSDEDKKASTTNDKKEKMIIQLAQKFVQLFLATRVCSLSFTEHFNVSRFLPFLMIKLYRY